MNNGRLFVNGQIYSRGYNLAHEAIVQPKDTFVSHQSSDRVTAERIAITLSGQGYPCYVDTLDPDIDGDSPQLESYLRQVIGRCRGLIAVVSRTTRSSWWVPLEIGVALEKEKHVATYSDHLGGPA